MMRPLITLGEGWTAEIRSACQDTCGEFGDPPCYALVGDTAAPSTPNPITPCDECRQICRDGKPA